jgi:hypothetical protein
VVEEELVKLVLEEILLEMAETEYHHQLLDPLYQGQVAEELEDMQAHH